MRSPIGKLAILLIPVLALPVLATGCETLMLALMGGSYYDDGYYDGYDTSYPPQIIVVDNTQYIVRRDRRGNEVRERYYGPPPDREVRRGGGRPGQGPGHSVGRNDRHRPDAGHAVNGGERPRPAQAVGRPERQRPSAERRQRPSGEQRPEHQKPSAEQRQRPSGEQRPERQRPSVERRQERPRPAPATQPAGSPEENQIRRGRPSRDS
jgi:hypothetical protein